MRIDTTKPHIGRVYDFVLGGHHNYEIDREFAARILSVFPSYPKFARLNRWFLQLVASRWAEKGIDRALDIGSGLPTQGHLNEYLSGARVLFSDNDPLSVTYGAELLKDSANMKYIMADAREPGPLLEEASRFFGDDRRVAIGFIGLAYLLPDEAVKRLAQRLYDWSAPGSVMALSYVTPYERAGQTESLASVAQMSTKMGVDLQVRTAERLAELVAPWRVVESHSIEKLLDVDGMLTEEDKTDIGVFMAGATLER